tara:strand:- start:206 stop:838 length:633 start_codon:yes stop_codon:yes gene_type:complete
MNLNDKNIKAETIVAGKIIRKYNLPTHEVDELNSIYEKNKNNLQSASSTLAGNIESELDITNILPTAKIINTMYECMQDCIAENSKLLQTKNFDNIKDYHITSAWINDMKDGEWNPPHTHNITKEGKAIGWSTVLFLKTPEMNNKGDLHKNYTNGMLTFIDVHGEKILWFKPKIGDFYIFDASHQHYVMPLQLKNPLEIRRSLSFNFEII